MKYITSFLTTIETFLCFLKPSILHTNVLHDLRYSVTCKCKGDRWQRNKNGQGKMQIAMKTKRQERARIGNDEKKTVDLSIRSWLCSTQVDSSLDV